MPKAPRSGPVGNQDNSKRGRGIKPKGEGRPAKSGTRLSGGKKDIDPDDVEGYGISGRDKR